MPGLSQVLAEAIALYLSVLSLPRKSFFPADVEELANEIIAFLSHFQLLFAANATPTAIPESNGPAGYCWI